jgi:hypothetical protein
MDKMLARESELAELERWYSLPSPETTIYDRFKKWPHFYLEISKDAPVRFRGLRNFFLYWDTKPVVGGAIEEATLKLALRLEIPQKYIGCRMID